ncbi:MAG: aryl-sulfate sulfotransferase [Planctomycetota bacterium]
MRWAPVLLPLLLAAPAAAQAPDPALRLYGNMSGTQTWLVDANGTTVHSWTSPRPPGLSVYLRDDGMLLRTINTGFLPGVIGGTGGGLQLQDLNSQVLWDFRYDGPGVWSHHDIEALPNGNVLMIAWEDKSPAQAIAAGRDPSLMAGAVFRPDHIIEVRPSGPTSGDIVWEWHAFDHVIQDVDATKANFGVVADHPELIDINYPPIASQANDWIHMNGVDYDPINDWIVLSANRLNEVWIIDHSTTTQEAAGHTGGRHGKGGDLLYRWGNPQAYDRGTSANQQLYGQHSANIIPEGYPGAGNVVLFNNNPPIGGSQVLEFVLPVNASGQFVTPAGEPFGPAAPIWTHSGGFRSTVVSSARRARNGNTLICSGSQGRVFEVTPQGQTVWSEQIFGSVFHAHYVEHYLWSDRTSLSSASGGSVNFDLIAGTPHANQPYVLVGSASGTSPGTVVRGVTLPLNRDSYFALTVQSAGFGPFVNSIGLLNSVGRATARLDIPPGFDLSGLHLDHAYIAIEPATVQIGLVSNAMPLDLLP